MDNCKCTRREFFMGAAKVVAGIGVATLISQPVFASGSKEAKGIEDGLAIDLKKPENMALKEIGGAVFIENPKAKKEKIIVYRESETEVKAFRSHCTHKGGPLKLPNEKGKMVCEWHRAEFDLKGNAIKKPAKESLEMYETSIAGEMIILKL